MQSIVGSVVGILVALSLAWLLLALVVWLHRPSRELAGPALRLIPDLVRLARSLLADPGTPPVVKVALAGLLVYLLLPFDLIPDVVPGIGALDDVVLTAGVLRWAGRRIGLEALRSHWSGTDAGFALLARLLGL